MKWKKKCISLCWLKFIQRWQSFWIKKITINGRNRNRLYWNCIIYYIIFLVFDSIFFTCYYERSGLRHTECFSCIYANHTHNFGPKYLTALETSGYTINSRKNCRINIRIRTRGVSVRNIHGEFLDVYHWLKSKYRNRTQG